MAKPKKTSPRSKAKPKSKGQGFLSLNTFLRLGSILLSLLGVLAALLFWQLNAPIAQSTSPIDAHITQGLSARAIGEELKAQGLDLNPALFALTARLTNTASTLKAGRYEVPKDVSLLGLLDFLSLGKGVLSNVTFVEGMTATQYISQLQQKTDLLNDLQNQTPIGLGQAWALEGGSLEGWIYPDTYRYAPGSKASDLLKRAVRLQKEELERAWAQRAPDSNLKSSYEALIMASIVEKETGQAKDRPKVSSVFNNRLRVGMMLQTDPTVIYGVGDAFKGNLTKAHLLTDTPYNTYTRAGLPPTPIANPGKASLYAAVRPEETQYYYFVAKGDGSSQFSRSLTEHNQAVRKYQLGR